MRTRLDDDFNPIHAGSAAAPLGAPRAAIARSVLLVDDEREILVVIEQALVASGYRVTTAVNGADALDKATALRPEAVVTDVLMPVIDGIGLAKALRSNPVTAATKIVLCSGVSEGSVRALFDRYDAFLQKPYELEQLQRTLRMLLAATAPVNADTAVPGGVPANGATACQSQAVALPACPSSPIGLAVAATPTGEAIVCALVADGSGEGARISA